jgi:hypothetical protein
MGFEDENLTKTGIAAGLQHGITADLKFQAVQ